MLYSYAQVVVERKLVAAQHFRPRKAVVAHARLASGLDGLAERATRVDGTIEADRSEQRAEEHLRVLVAMNIQQRNPTTSASRAFAHSVVFI